MNEQQLIEWLKSTAKPSFHRENLSKMVISYLRMANEMETEQDKQDVYHTFYVLNQLLKEL